MTAQNAEVAKLKQTSGLLSGLSRMLASSSQIAKIEAVQMVVWRRQTGKKSYRKCCNCEDVMGTAGATSLRPNSMIEQNPLNLLELAR